MGLLVGGTAANHAGADPSRYQRCPKRLLGVDDKVLLGGSEIRVVELVGAVLRAVSERAIQEAGCPPERVVLTHPARWAKRRLTALCEAATLAGLGAVSLVAEPVAAGFGSGLRPDENTPIAVYDLGGGTFDAAVLKGAGGAWTVAGKPGGLDPCGGESFDAALHACLIERVRAGNPARADAIELPSSEADRQAARHWWADVRTTKEELSETASVIMPVPGTEMKLSVTDRELVDLVSDDISATVEELVATIRASGVAPAAIGRIVLTGDASSMPAIRDAVDQRFPELGRDKITLANDPKAVVVLGAAAVTDRPAQATPSAPAPEAGELTAQEVCDASFKNSPTGTPGYKKEMVDNFLDEIEANLRGRRKNLTPALIRNVEFGPPPLGRRGYDQQEVDTFLARCEAAIAKWGGADSRSRKASTSKGPAAAPTKHPLAPVRPSIGINAMAATRRIAGLVGSTAANPALCYPEVATLTAQRDEIERVNAAFYPSGAPFKVADAIEDPYRVLAGFLETKILDVTRTVAFGSPAFIVDTEDESDGEVGVLLLAPTEDHCLALTLVGPKTIAAGRQHLNSLGQHRLRPDLDWDVIPAPPFYGVTPSWLLTPNGMRVTQERVGFSIKIDNEVTIIMEVFRDATLDQVAPSVAEASAVATAQRADPGLWPVFAGPVVLPQGGHRMQAHLLTGAAKTVLTAGTVIEGRHLRVAISAAGETKKKRFGGQPDIWAPLASLFYYLESRA